METRGSTDPLPYGRRERPRGKRSSQVLQTLLICYLCEKRLSPPTDCPTKNLDIDFANQRTHHSIRSGGKKQICCDKAADMKMSCSLSHLCSKQFDSLDVVLSKWRIFNTNVQGQGEMQQKSIIADIINGMFFFVSNQIIRNHKECGGVYTHLRSTTLASALDIGLSLFGSNRKLVPELFS